MASFHWNSKQYSAVGYIVVALLLSFAATAGGKTPQPPPSSEEQAEYIEKQPDGTQVQIIRWAIGTRDHVVKLRIPAGHVSLWNFGPGAFLAGNAAKDQKPPEVAQEFLFQGLYPGMQIRTKENFDEFKVPGGGRVVNGFVTTGFIPIGDLQRAYDIKQKVSKDFLIFVAEERKKEFSLKEGNDLYSLRQLSVDPILLYMETSKRIPKNFYYVGSKPEESILFITCDSDIIGEPEETPGSYIVPHCEHTFKFEPLSALVALRYRRNMLKSWREIQEQTEQLLLSFIPKSE